MFNVFYDDKGIITDVTPAEEYVGDKKYIVVERLPYVTVYQEMRVIDEQLKVIDKELTNEEWRGLRQQELATLISDYEQKLQESDYRTLKYIEGAYTEEEFKVYKEERAEWRQKINEYQEELNNLMTNSN